MLVTGSPRKLRVPRWPLPAGTASKCACHATVWSTERASLRKLYLVDRSARDAPTVPADFKLKLRANFNGRFALFGGFDHATAEKALLVKRGDLVAFVRPFLTNPDLVARMRMDAARNTSDMTTFYSAGAKGYTYYPAKAA